MAEGTGMDWCAAGVSLWVTHLWQLSGAALLLGALALWVGQRRPQLSHLLWLLVLLKCLTPPLWSSPGGLFCWLRPATDAATSEAAGAAADALLSERSANAWGADDASLAAVTQWSADTVSAEPAGPRSGVSRWLVALLAVWLAGSGLLAARWAVIAIVWRRRLGAARRPADETLQDLVERLRRRLGVRRRVELWVVAGRTGPAVLGWLRPRLLLPELLLEGREPSDLEPILAHELLHVRRGDLGASWLRLLARCLWWFHPLVHWAARHAELDAERCCDEAVLAELGCGPARYARCLLDVLERKHRLRAVPLAPGMRPVDITSQRMERIMRLKDCRRRTPLAHRLAALALALVVLPGAALVGDDPLRNVKDPAPAGAAPDKPRLNTLDPSPPGPSASAAGLPGDGSASARPLLGLGVDSDAGLSGQLLLEEPRVLPPAVAPPPAKQHQFQLLIGEARTAKLDELRLVAPRLWRQGGVPEEQVDGPAGLGLERGIEVLEQDIEHLQRALQPDGRVLSRPQLVTTDGRPSVVQITPPNLRLSLRPRETGDMVECSMQLEVDGRIAGVERRQAVNVTLKMAPGVWYLIRGLRPLEPAEDQEMLIAICVTPVEQRASAGDRATEATRSETVRPAALLQATQAATPLQTRVYAVADLITPIGHEPPLNATLERRARELAELLRAGVEPESWQRQGGQGAVEFYANNLSLVIRQSEANHERIEKWLEELRNWETVTLEGAVIETTIDVMRASGFDPDAISSVVAAGPVARLVADASSLKRTPRASLFPGQELQLAELGAIKVGERTRESLRTLAYHRPLRVEEATPGAEGRAVGWGLHSSQLRPGVDLARDVPFGASLVIDVTTDPRPSPAFRKLLVINLKKE